MAGNNIQNPGSAIGEAIGASMEAALGEFLKIIAEANNHHYIAKSPFKGKKKLLMYDQHGTGYNIDSVIANESMQPIILFESKYIRYKKHNRDKGSWLCTAHPAVRRKYHSIRSSIAILAGNWSSSSIAMMRSYDINIFLIPYQKICGFLELHGVNFDWGEKDRAQAFIAWQKYAALPDDTKLAIGRQMADLVKPDLKNLVTAILDNKTERLVSRVTIELHSNLGEVKCYDFEKVNDAVDFLNQKELGHMFITADSLTLFDLLQETDINDEET